jgi:hypothetical protein
VLVPLIVPFSGSGTPTGALGLLATNPGAVTSGYAWTYSSKAKTLPAYTSTPLNSAFTGGLLDLLQAARLSDLNTTRAAYENLRVFTESLANQHNQLCADLVAAGIIST